MSEVNRTQQKTWTQLWEDFGAVTTGLKAPRWSFLQTKYKFIYSQQLHQHWISFSRDQEPSEEPQGPGSKWSSIYYWDLGFYYSIFFSFVVIHEEHLRNRLKDLCRQENENNESSKDRNEHINGLDPADVTRTVFSVNLHRLPWFKVSALDTAPVGQNNY